MNKDGQVSLTEVNTYVFNTLDAVLTVRRQTPTITGDGDVIVSKGRERGPNLQSFRQSQSSDASIGKTSGNAVVEGGNFSLDVVGQANKLAEQIAQLEQVIVRDLDQKEREVKTKASGQWNSTDFVNLRRTSPKVAVDAIWKPRNIKRFYKEFEITTTTVEGVQEAFREEYGLASELPVLKTEFGNLAFSTVQLDPLIFAAYAMQGAEIMLRTATYFFEEDVVATAMYNNFYSAMSNIPGKAPYGGNSIVVDPNGKIMGQLSHTEEGVLQIDIPIAEFREGRRLPQYSVALTKSVFDQYQEEIPANHLDMPAEELPQNGRVMKELLDSVSRW